jgi:hypothetical protein
MESKLARHAEQQLIEAARKLSPAERDAYVRAVDVPFAGASLRVIGREDFQAGSARMSGAAANNCSLSPSVYWYRQ